MKGKHIILLILFFSSCELVTEVDVPAIPPRLVINSLFHPDSSWTIYISQNRYILDNHAPPPPSNVTISLVNEGGVDITLDDGVILNDNDLFERYLVFKSTSKPVAGVSYTVSVSAPGFPDAEATAITPSVVELLNARLDSANMIPMNDYSSGSIPIEFTFQDPPGVGDHYILTFLVGMKWRMCDLNRNCWEELHWQPGWLTESVEVEAFAELSSNQVEILSDDLFDGKLHTVRL